MRDHNHRLAPVTRRSLLGGLTAGAIGSAFGGRPASAASTSSNGGQRQAAAFRLRLEAARLQQRGPVRDQTTNGDESRYPSRIGNYTKGLPHDARGEVDRFAYDSLLAALRSGDPADFERIAIGDGAKLVNPQAGLAFDLHGLDSHSHVVMAPPAFASGEQAGEIAENYWMALARDVPFSQYASDPIMARAAADLSRLQDFRGPRRAGRVAPDTLFRGLTAGDLAGPYLSQFLCQPAPFGAETVDRRMRTAHPGTDFLTQYGEWLRVQNGAAASAHLLPDPTPRYMRSGRDLAIWVRNDVIFQAYFDAVLILLDRHVPFDPGLPYLDSRTQAGFGTFGAPHVASALCAVATRALKAAWFQKWYVHRRLRPEMFAGRIDNHVNGVASYPFHPDVLRADALAEVHGRTGSFLLPMAYPEGSPLHPSYAAGHATVGGACVTILKAFFDESAELPDPVESTPDGLALQPYTGPALTVGGELNKLASNIALGRNIAGVHWRSDASASLALGEQVALGYLAEERLCMNEAFEGFTLTTFGGTRASV